MIKTILTRGTLGLATTSMAMVGFATTASAQSIQQQPMTQSYMTHMTSLNGSGASGVAYVSVTGNQATVMIRSYGLSANLPHAQHIHIGGNHVCPTLADDANHDGLISTSEGMNAYGDALIGLTTSGDVSVNSELAVPRYPVATNDGMVTYERTFTLPVGVTPADVAGGVVVQHGVSSLFNDPTMYDGSAKDLAVDATLPLEATIPADCGILRNVTPPMVDMSNTYTAGFDQSINRAVVQLQNATNNNDVSATFSTAYRMATTNFNQTLSAAARNYSMLYMTNSGVARDNYINSFNNAKATYLNVLESARNNTVSSLSGNNDVAKDVFVNNYNSVRDMYANNLEMLKNSFANGQ